MNFEKFKTEFNTDPAGIGYSGMDAKQKWVAVSTKNRDGGKRPVVARELLLWASESGRLSILRDLAADTGQTKEARSLADVAAIMIGRADTLIADFVSVMDQLIATGALKGTDKDDLFSLAALPLVSRLEQIECSDVNESTFFELLKKAESV